MNITAKVVSVSRIPVSHRALVGVGQPTRYELSNGESRTFNHTWDFPELPLGTVLRKVGESWFIA